MCGRHKTCHRNSDHNRDKQTCFHRISLLLINVTVTVNEVQVPPSWSLSWVGVEVILWTAHCTSDSVSWLYLSFLNYPNKLVHLYLCATSVLAVLILLLVLFYMWSSQLWLLRVWITCHHNHQYCIFYASKAKHKLCLNVCYTSSTSICAHLSPILLTISCPSQISIWVWYGWTPVTSVQQVFSLDVLCFKYLSATPSHL